MPLTIQIPVDSTSVCQWIENCKDRPRAIGAFFYSIVFIVIICYNVGTSGKASLDYKGGLKMKIRTYLIIVIFIFVVYFLCAEDLKVFSNDELAGTWVNPD